MPERDHVSLLKAVLQKVDIFQSIPPEIIENLSAKIKVTEFSAGTLIIKKGDAGDAMYVLLKGKVKIHDGEHVVAEMNEGNFFGELSILDSEPRSMSVTALEPVVAAIISQEIFYSVLNNHPDIIRKIISSMSGRLRNQNTKIIEQFRSRQQELENLVDIRTKDLNQKNTELSKTLDELRKTQEQLIKQEKLASLGQLSAGIAHEIQNPLNFVNNFSQLSKELIEEMKTLKSEEERNFIIEDLRENLERINQHGKRADSIVKGMLEHTRTGKGQKKLTDINRLCEEYYTLALHSWKAIDPEFECVLEKNFNVDLPEINVVPQEISKVFINIFNNAFYAMKEKSEMQKLKPDGSVYEPHISVSTSGNTIQGEQFLVIKIRDNGTGMSEKVVPQIFNPFFTTKPTGKGNTGLGLTLTYDFVKSNGGELTATSEEGKFAEFVISLPMLTS